MKKASLVLANASEVVTFTNSERPVTGADVKILKNAWIAVDGGKIVAVGGKSVLNDVNCSDAEMIDVSGKTIIPGFVDPHTHLVFDGSREDELTLKAQGVAYMEILRQGGGILRTVRETRKASEDKLVENAKKTLQRMLEYGTTTIEAKSGYGLDEKTELKILNATKKAGEQCSVTVIPTFLGAHAVPPEKNQTEYVNDVMKMIPAASKLAKYCDVFCEKGVFTVEETRKIFEEGKKHGLSPRIHADELTCTGGAELAAEMGAASADHLLCASKEGVKEMAEKKITAVFLPSTSLSSMLPYANARQFIDAGVPFALGTDFNPNCLTESMQLVTALACRYLKMTAAEALAASTINAARSLGVGSEVGSIDVGKKADLVVLNAPNHAFLPYHFGVNLVETVVKDGKIVVNKSD